jgi:hypothetical protein
MNEQFTQLLVKERQSVLLADAQLHKLGRQQTLREPLLRIRLTLELKLGRWELGSAERLQPG